MAACDMCGNEYDKAFTITMNGRTQTFDSFECAIHMLAPKCAHFTRKKPAPIVPSASE